MTDSDNRLYLYDDIIELVINTDLPAVYRDNRPMNPRKIKAHKGVTNEILFNIRDRDRKLQDMSNNTLWGHIIDTGTNYRVVSKQVTNLPDTGKVKLTIDAGDIESLRPGDYKLYMIIGEDGTGRPIYTDQDNNVIYELEITNQIGVQPIPTQEQNVFLQTGNSEIGEQTDSFVTNALRGNLERNFMNAQHTTTIFLDDYTGNIRIQASCLSDVPASSFESTEWFTVKEIEIVDANVNTITENFVVNANWIRITSEPTTGSIEKVLLRN